MRDAFRSGDVWPAHSRRYGDVKRALVPIEAVHATARLAVPFEAREWLAERKAGLVEGLEIRPETCRPALQFHRGFPRSRDSVSL